MINRYMVFLLGEIIARIKRGPPWSRLAWPLMHACGPYFGPRPGRKPGARSAPGYPWKTCRRIERGAAAAERKNLRRGARLRGPCCTGRAWWPVDLGTWAAPGGRWPWRPARSYSLPGKYMRAQLFADLVSWAVVPGRWPLPGGRSQVAAPRWPVARCRWPGRVPAGVLAVVSTH